MYRLFLERPVALLLCWIAVQFALICLWSWRRSGATRRAAVVGFVALPALLGLSYAVVTPAEQIMSQCHAVARSVDDGDMGVISRTVAPEFKAAGLDRDAFLARVEQTLTRVRVDHPRLSGITVDVSGDTAIATLTVVCRVRSHELTLDSLATRWRVAFRRHDGTWLITSIESVPVPPLNIRRMEEWLR
jgi:ketosteroid isomerase-like protein